jgi:hypothetical protein
MDFVKTPRHNKVRHNLVAPLQRNDFEEEAFKKKVIPPIAKWTEEIAPPTHKWNASFEDSVRNTTLSRKNAVSNLNPPEHALNKLSVGHIDLTSFSENPPDTINDELLSHNNNNNATSNMNKSHSNGRVGMHAEDIDATDDVLTGNLNVRHDKEYKDVEMVSTSSSSSTHRSMKKDGSQHSVFSTSSGDLDGSGVPSSPALSPHVGGAGGSGEGGGGGGGRVPLIDTQRLGNRTGSASSMSSETLERLEIASRPRTASILKRGSALDLIYDRTSSARLIREDERRVSWSDLHHGKELTQVREVDYGESKLHRIMRQNKTNVIVTAVLFMVVVLTISISLGAASVQMSQQNHGS